MLLELFEAELSPRIPETTKTFEKTLEKWKRSGQHSQHIKDLKNIVIPTILERKVLPPEYKDHPLTGQKWGGYRECHLGGDALFVYKLPDKNRFILVAVGSHSELFN